MRAFSIAAALAAALFALLVTPGCKDDKDGGFTHEGCPTPVIGEGYRYCVSEDGGTIDIDGADLGGESVDEVRVTIAGTAATSVTVAPTFDKVTATFGSLSPTGEQTLVVTNVCEGEQQSAEWVAVVTPALEITGIEPQFESPCGGARVTITGRGFIDGMNVSVNPPYQDFFSSFSVTGGGSTIEGILALNEYGSGITATVRVEYYFEGCTVYAEDSYAYDQVECDPEDSGFTELTSATGHQVVGVGDFDGDGHKDIVVAHFDRLDVRVFEGDGNGDFPSQYTLTLGAGDEAIALDVTDLNGDGRDDVVIAVQGNDDAVSLLQSGGALTVHTDRGEIGGEPLDIVAAHLNGDEHMDVATVSRVSSLVSVMFGDGTGAFPTFAAVVASNGVALAAGATDTGTRLTDLYMATSSTDESSSGVTTIRNLTSGGTFSYSTARTTTWTKPQSLIYHDTSYKDGPEVITADGSYNSISFVSDFTDGVPGDVESISFSGAPYLLAGGRFVGTGDTAQLVVLMTDASNGQLQLLATVPTKSPSLGFTGVPVSIATGDLNEDGYDDVVIGRAGAGELLILFSE